jgi:ABC-type iron transport system FetAB permease component
MVCKELLIYVGYMVVQFLVAGYILGWSLVYKSRMTPSYLLSSAGAIAIVYFLCARGYKAVVWWILAIAISSSVILDVMLLLDKRFKDFSVNVLKLVDKEEKLE